MNRKQSEEFPHISLMEDVTMHMAKICGLNVANHGLIKLKSGELAYVTKRFDRLKKVKKKWQWKIFVN